jgi:hypothetical protein
MQAVTGKTHFTMGEIAQRHGCKQWQVRRLYQRGMLPPAERIGAFRVVPIQGLPQVEAALRAAGYIREKEVVACP